MSEDGPSAPTLDRAAFQKLAVASLIPILAATPTATNAGPPPSPTPPPFHFSEQQWETLVAGVLQGLIKTLQAVQVFVTAHDRCPPDNPPFYAGSRPHSVCPHFGEAIKDLKAFVDIMNTKGFSGP
jgi:hypothetical protein